MFKKAWLVAVFCAATSAAFADKPFEVGDRGSTTIFTNQTLSASYVAASNVLDLNSYDSASVVATVNNGVTGVTVSLLYQWSLNGTTWVTEQALNAGTVSSTEAPYTALNRRIDFSGATSSSTPYIERVRRLSRYFRVQVKGSTATTATVAITAIPMNNQN